MAITPENSGSATTEPGDGLLLSGDSGRCPKLSKADELKYERLYSKKWRQIRRWIDRGEENADPCPLHDPARMPGWWARNMKWRIPQEIEAAAIDATRGPDSSGMGSVAEMPPAGEPAPKSMPPPAAQPAQPAQQIDLESFDPEEGDRLRELKQIQAAKFSQLKEALRLGQECSVQEGKYLKLCETIDKIESRVTERLKKRGLYILREQVERDAAASAELLRQSHDAMVRRVLEYCPSLNAEQRAEVSEAILKARATEQRMLCRLDSLTSTDLLKELAA